MSELITDEMVEAAAKARWDYERAESGDPTEWEMRYPTFREFDLDSMRAALVEVAPLIAARARRDGMAPPPDRSWVTYAEPGKTCAATKAGQHCKRFDPHGDSHVWVVTAKEEER